jgi:hypothetical protein
MTFGTFDLLSSHLKSGLQKKRKEKPMSMSQPKKKKSGGGSYKKSKKAERNELHNGWGKKFS